MADNTVLNAGSGGDTIRDLARQSGSVKTPVAQLDIGGASGNAEVLVTAGQHAMAASMPVVIASDQTAVPVTQAAITKGTQGATGVTTQDLKDAGRTYVTLTLDAVAGITTEALGTMSINKGGTVTTGTSYTVTAGKTLRIIFFGSSVKNTSTVASNSRARVRSAASVTATSGILIANECGAAAAVANCSATDDSPVPEGIEVAGGQQVGISHIESATTSTMSCCAIGYEY